MDKLTKLSCSLFLLSVLAVPGSCQGTDLSDLRGLWGCETIFGPELRGTLSLRNTPEGWMASIADQQALAAPTPEGLRAVFPEDLGTLELEGREPQGVWQGHWIQPRGVMLFQAWSTPVQLTPEGKDGSALKGQVWPMDDRLSVYVEFEPDERGRMQARMRSPERNIGIGYDLGPVRLIGRDLQLLDSGGTVVLLQGRLGEDGESWVLDVPGWNTSVRLERRDRDSAPGYYPRPSADDRYTYRVPVKLADGWPVCEAEEAGLDRGPLEELIQHLVDQRYENRFSPYVQGLCIARRGKLVLDEYFYGFHADRVHDTRSATKSLTAVLTGLAIDRGAAFGLETPVVEVFADRDIQNVDDAKRKLTIEHLLTMSTGLDCDDDDDASPGNEATVQSQTEQPDWIAYALDLPMIEPAGTRGVYCTVGINLLGGAIEQAGFPLEVLLREAYAKPLEIPIYHMNLSPMGLAYMGGGTHFRPRDHMKLGQLLVDQGRWKGRQIISADWIERTSAAHASLNREDDYGYGVWRRVLTKGDESYQAIYASGNGGQLVIAIPELELVVHFAGGNYNNGGTWGKFLTELVPDYVLPAVLD